MEEQQKILNEYIKQVQTDCNRLNEILKLLHSSKSKFLLLPEADAKLVSKFSNLFEQLHIDLVGQTVYQH